MGDNLPEFPAEPARRGSPPADLSFWDRVWKCARENLKPALSTIRFLLIIMLSVSFAVLILDASGVLFYVSRFMNPVMKFLGLPGEASLAYISAMLINVYSAIAVIETMTLSGKQMIILATMCLIAHNFFVECLVMKKTGSHLSKIVLLRIFVSLLAGWIMHFIVPAGAPVTGMMAPKVLEYNPGIGLDLSRFIAGLGPWFVESILLVLKIFLIVFSIMFMQRILGEFGLMKKLSRIASPLISLFGLPPKAAYVWIIGTTVGVAYGAGILIEEVKAGNLTRSDADLFNHHAAISHSQIEDTVLFVSLGVPYLWAALPRLLLAIIVVWVERARRALFRSSFRVKLV
jgi:spore maturation protein SpmB